MKKELWIAFAVLVLLGVIGFVLRGFAHPYRVPTVAMAPAIPADSYVFVNDWAYQSADQIERGHVIVFEPPPSEFTRRGEVKSIYVFRVLGLPGDTISYNENGQFQVNGQDLEQTTRGEQTLETQSGKRYVVQNGRSRSVGEIEVKEGHFFVAGDNRPQALDSRYWGTVPFDLVKGRARVD